MLPSKPEVVPFIKSQRSRGQQVAFICLKVFGILLASGVISVACILGLVYVTKDRTPTFSKNADKIFQDCRALRTDTSRGTGYIRPENWPASIKVFRPVTVAKFPGDGETWWVAIFTSTGGAISDEMFGYVVVGDPAVAQQFARSYDDVRLTPTNHPNIFGFQASK